MDIESIVIIALLLFVALLLFLLIKNKISASADMQEVLSKVLRDQTISLLKTFDETRLENRNTISAGLLETQKFLGDSLSKSQTEVSERLKNLMKETGQIQSASVSMLEVAKDVKRLNMILEGPKSKGSFGEAQLEEILADILPVSKFERQFKVGEGRVDFAVRFKDRVLCIDSKFPSANLVRFLESPGDEKERFKKAFHTDVKKHAADIQKKYIEPSVTLDFAIMYLPSETAFLEVISDPAVHSAIKGMKVIPASPNFLFAYIQAIAMGFRGLAVAERADEIIREIDQMKTGFEKMRKSFETMGAHMDNAMKQYNETWKQVGKYGASLNSLKVEDDEENKS
jgi:DNA recombination protein RmuC